jgi:hypothetical protein
MKNRRLYLIHVQHCIARMRDYIQEGKVEVMRSTW